MKKQMRQYLGPLCVSVFAFLVGCAGESSGFGTNALGQDPHSLLLLGDVAPLATIDVERWESAFAGCEGLLSNVQEYGIAEGQPELVVGMDLDRDIVCVDSYASIESELAMRSSDDVDALWLGYVAALQLLEAHSGMEPEPQTNSGAEPEPQTNDDGSTRSPDTPSNGGLVAPLIDLRVVSGDPDPQPNAPVVRALVYDVDLHESDAQ